MSEWKETDIIPKVPLKWNEFKLNEIGDFKNGVNFSAESFGEGYPVINVKQLYQTRFASIDGLDEIIPESVKRIDEYELKNGDLLFVRSSVTLQGTGQIVMVNKLPLKRTVFSGFIIRFRITSNKVIRMYLNYLLRTKFYKEHFINIAAGTSIINISQDTLKNISIFLPPLPEQKVIASVLSSLDDKIDILHRQNKTLETMAETLFRQWFIEEADDEWEVRPLGELVTVKRGGSPRPIQEYISETGLRWLKISDATKTSSPFIFEIKEHIKEEGLKKTTLLKKGTLVLSNSATPGIPKILQVDSCIHDGWLHFPKSHFSNEFLYLLFINIRQELINQGNGSIFTNLKTDILKEFPIPIPSDKSLQDFDDKVKQIFQKLLRNSIQIRTLEKLRDTLLPKLMSGEVRVKC